MEHFVDDRRSVISTLPTSVIFQGSQASAVAHVIKDFGGFSVALVRRSKLLISSQDDLDFSKHLKPDLDLTPCQDLPGCQTSISYEAFETAHPDRPLCLDRMRSASLSPLDRSRAPLEPRALQQAVSFQSRALIWARFVKIWVSFFDESLR